MAETRFMTINMGPQHPATHGVLRLVLELDGEIIVKATPHIGHLHRGVEKLGESKTYHQFIPLTDRLDYTNAMGNNLAYVLAVEKLLGIEVPKRAQYLRVMMAELQRIAAHLIWLGTHVLDLGATTPIFYTFREREDILRIFDEVAGGRLTPTYMRIGGVSKDLPNGIEEKVKAFVETFPEHMKEYETLLTENVIWLNRTKKVGILSKEDAMNWGVTGPTLRASGVKWDVRKAFPYSSYDEFDFDIPVGSVGDVYDRYVVRLREMEWSNSIAKQALERMPKGPVIAGDPKVDLPQKEAVMSDIASLIRHFKIVSEGFYPPKGEVYASVESAKGELGFYVVSDGSNHPFRVRIRPPSFLNLSALPKMIEGSLIADVVTTIGSIDIVLGEIDR
ncbi:MAG TPA: NADH dehydrogenase (quinone) subunit D [Thermodesulfobacteriota bacterium]|nr:NADH dehydrogenase (quinone) subunit D [Thermodesulfobacteriota bacterium]